MSTEAIDPPSHGPTGEYLVHEVVGPPLTAVEAGVAIALGIVALLLAGAMPVLLGALASEHRLAVGQIGVTAMAEALTMGLAAAACGALVKPARLRLIGLIAVLAVAVINLAMIWASGLGVIGLRALAGAAEGVLLWITIGMIARSETPERWAGVFYAGLTLCQFVLTAALTTVVTPRWHASGERAHRPVRSRPLRVPARRRRHRRLTAVARLGRPGG
jgi:DHA1 family inner membrane transport protein